MAGSQAHHESIDHRRKCSTYHGRCFTKLRTRTIQQQHNTSSSLMQSHAGLLSNGMANIHAVCRELLFLETYPGSVFTLLHLLVAHAASAVLLAVPLPLAHLLPLQCIIGWYVHAWPGVQRRGLRDYVDQMKLVTCRRIAAKQQSG